MLPKRLVTFQSALPADRSCTHQPAIRLRRARTRPFRPRRQLRWKGPGRPSGDIGRAVQGGRDGSDGSAGAEPRSQRPSTTQPTLRPSWHSRIRLRQARGDGQLDLARRAAKCHRAGRWSLVDQCAGGLIRPTVSKVPSTPSQFAAAVTPTAAKRHGRGQKVREPPVFIDRQGI